MDYKKLFDLTGKVCVVTGGMGYLGAENVKILKDFGATVVVTDIREAEDRWANAAQAVGDMFVACDVSSSESIRQCFQTIADKYGKIDVLVTAPPTVLVTARAASWNLWMTPPSTRAWTVPWAWCSGACGKLCPS